ncbi:MAG: hypothetical protein NXI24_02555 [bacterium]|nr:hypothetical protein [bacterium]
MFDLSQLNDGILDNGVLDFSVRSYTDNRLVLVGSFDLAYYQDIQIEFGGVSFLSVPTEFSDASFRCLRREECGELLDSFSDYMQEDDRVFAVDLSRFYDVQTHYIVANSIQYAFGKVYYYRRDKLEPGESIAPWVLASQPPVTG